MYPYSSARGDASLPKPPPSTDSFRDAAVMTASSSASPPLPAPTLPAKTGSSTVDDAEIARFSAIAAEWWDPAGKFRPLHRFNPVRIAYIRDALIRTFNREPRAPRPLAGLRLVDIGCGGGLLAEPLARLGADVVLAFPLPGSRGTWNCVRQALKAGLVVRVLGDGGKGGR